MVGLYSALFAVSAVCFYDGRAFCLLQCSPERFCIAPSSGEASACLYCALDCRNFNRPFVINKDFGKRSSYNPRLFYPPLDLSRVVALR